METTQVRTVFRDHIQSDEGAGFSVTALYLPSLSVLLVHFHETSGAYRKVTRCLGTGELSNAVFDEFPGAVRLAVKEADLFIEKVREANGWPF